MDLYDHPPDFCPRTPDPLSRAARVWCLGGIAWMGVGLFLLFLSFVKTGICTEWGMFCPAMNPGILRQTAVGLLVYGWGLPMMWGMALLLLGRKCAFDPAWSRAGAWGWHGVILGGAVAVLCGHGSGLSAMPFPVAVWPVLVLALVPALFVMVDALKNDAWGEGIRGRLSFMSVLLGIFYLIGGTISVFFVTLTAYYRSLAAECTTFGLAFGILIAFVLTIHLPERRENSKYEWGFVLSWVVFVLVQSVLFVGFRSGMMDKWLFLILALAGFVCAVILAVNRLYSLKKSGVWVYRVMVSCWYIWGAWYYLYAPSAVPPGFSERPGAWLVHLLMLLMGIFACFSALFLYERVPYATGRDWLSRRALVYPLVCWAGGSICYFVGMFVSGGKSSESPVSSYWLVQSWVGVISVLVLLVGWGIFAVHVMLVWSGRGRIAAAGIFDLNKSEASGKELKEEKGVALK